MAHQEATGDGGQVEAAGEAVARSSVAEEYLSVSFRKEICAVVLVLVGVLVLWMLQLFWLVCCYWENRSRH